MAKNDALYMKFANAMAEISKSERLKVGAVLVTKNGVVLTGVNGLPKQLGNELEEKQYNPDELRFSPEYNLMDEEGLDYKLTTKQTVIHAELNCLLKAAKEGVSVVKSTVYITHSPCQQCASMLISAGVKHVVYETPVS